MVLCDHCDAMYGFKCISPPLKKAPLKAWHCPDCRPKLKSVKGVRMLSAVAEHAARKRAEMGDLPKKKIKQTMYLVKWAGLGYEFCTWETREDVNDERLMFAYHRLNDTFPDESDMPEGAIDDFLNTTKHVNVENAGGISFIPELRSQLYAQSRALQFVKFGDEVPDLVCSECGPYTKGVPKPDEDPTVHPREVVEAVADIVFRVAMKQRPYSVRSNTSLPPLMSGEYDAIIPTTQKGLMMNVGEMHGSVAFLGYRAFPDGSKAPAELSNLIRNVGDKIIAVDGVSTIGKSFKDVIVLLRESGKQRFAYMRFLENRYAACDSKLSSAGLVGRYAVDELQKKFTSDRKKMVVQRTQQLIEEEQQQQPESEEEEEAESEKDNSDDDSAEGSGGEFKPESDDEEVGVENSNVVSAAEKTDPETPAAPAPTSLEVDATVGTDAEAVGESMPTLPGVIYRQETTRSLAYRLLDVDLGYSSDEGGDADCAYFMDGTDVTFTRQVDVADLVPSNKGSKAAKNDGKAQVTIPARQNEFSTLGERGKLSAAAALTSKPASHEEFDSFPYPSSRDTLVLEKEERNAQETSDSPLQTKGKRSTVKVEQVSVSTGEVLHIWANVESAAATLQLPLNQLRSVLRGEYDDDLGDEVGGYRWRFALAGAKVTAGTGSTSRGGKKAKEAWLEFRDKLYDPAEPHLYKNGNRLRDYQVDGVNWLASTWYKRQGCILADEMGCKYFQSFLRLKESGLLTLRHSRRCFHSG